MRHLLALLLLGSLSLHAQTATKAEQHLSKVQKSELELAMKIRQTYEQFIDTKPSKKKDRLALQVKADIETFEATYPNASFMPETLALLREVDIYLDTQH